MDDPITCFDVPRSRRTPLMTLLDTRPSRSAIKYFLKYYDVNVTYLKDQNILQLCKAKRNWKIVLKHNVSLNIYETILKNRNFSDYNEMCLKELALVKITKIQNHWVTFFNLLLDEIRKLYDRSTEVLSKKLKIFKPSHLIVRNILDDHLTSFKRSNCLKLCRKN